MFLYGREFPDFVAGIQPVAHLAWLPDVARLEWALRKAYHATDVVPVSSDELRTTSPEAFLKKRFLFAPAVQLLRSEFPVSQIRDYALGHAASPNGGPETLLITRPDYDPVATRLPNPQADLMNALLDNKPLGAALDEAPDADLSALLALLLQHNALHALTQETPK